MLEISKNIILPDDQALCVLDVRKINKHEFRHIIQDGVMFR
jgi:hypothetical protein